MKFTLDLPNSPADFIQQRKFIVNLSGTMLSTLSPVSIFDLIKDDL